MRLILPRIWFVYLLLTLILSAHMRGGETTQGEDPDPSKLTIERIFGKSEFNAKGFAGKWLKHEDAYVLLEDSKQTPGTRDIVRYDAESGERTILVPGNLFRPNAEAGPLRIESFSFSSDISLVLLYTNSKRVWRTNSRGDYWVLDRSSRQLHQVAADAKPSTTMFAKLAPTADRVAYVRDGDIFVEDLRDGQVQQVTQRSSEQIINGTFDWVYEEEFGLRDGFRWSPDGEQIAYWQLDTTNVPVFTMINNTDSMYPRLIQFAHPKTGQRNSACRVGAVRLNSRQTTWMRVEGDPRDSYIARMDWVNDNQLVLQRLNRLQNKNQVLLADVHSGETQPLLTETDEAWVDVHDDLHWLDDGDRYTWVSDRNGFLGVYLGSRRDGTLRRISPADFDVTELLHVDEKQQAIYFLASPDNATQRYLYRSGFSVNDTARLTPADQPGSHAYRIAPSGNYAIHTRSSAGEPPQIDLISLPDHRVIRSLEENSKLREKLAKLDVQSVEFFRVDIGEGVELDAWCIKPPTLEPEQKYPLLVYVYGEPAGSTVVDRWGGSGYLWHQLLAQQGYVVMSFDNRGTKVPRGRAWRKSIYRQVGIVAPRDQAAAVQQVLKQRSYLDPNRVGIWGWSGGGSMSLNAIFKFPELYKTAISVAPVPNQRYYDTIYQERYMGLPSDNAQGYLDGSPINFAHQLQGDLLLIHGTGDDNCHYQTMEMLINELILHNKQFSMMAYPNRSHAIREGKNTTRHLRELMTRFIQSRL